jgi:hypothetical protein
MSGNVFSKRYAIGTYGVAFSSLGGMFVACKDYFDNHPGFRRIASYSGSLPSSGFDAVWGDNPLGERAFCVWRAVSASNNVDSTLVPNGVPTFDIAISVAYNEVTTTNPRSWKSTLDYGLTFSMAWHQSSRSWAGTANNNGTDTFTAGAAAPFSASSIVLPRVNGASGTDATNRNGMITIDDATFSVTNPNMFFTGDNDTVSIIFKPDTQPYCKAIIFGGYQRVSSAFREPLFLWDGTPRGTDIGSSLDRTGGGCITTASNGGRVARIDYPRSFGNTNDTGTKENLDLSVVVEFPITIFQYETSHYRPAGYLHNISASLLNTQAPLFYGSGSNQRLIAKIAGTGDTNVCLTFPWSGSLEATII